MARDIINLLANRSEIPPSNFWANQAQTFQAHRPPPKPEEPKPDYLGFGLGLGSLGLGAVTGGASLPFTLPFTSGPFR